MAGKKLDESGFINEYLSRDIPLSVQCYFLYKVRKINLAERVSKQAKAFNATAYEVEMFYKPIHIHYDESPAS